MVLVMHHLAQLLLLCGLLLLLLLIIDDEDQLAGYAMNCATLSMASGWGGEGKPEHIYRSIQQLRNLIAVREHIPAFPRHHPHHNLEWFDWDAVSSGSLVTPIATPIPDTAPSAPVGPAIYFLTFMIAFIVRRKKNALLFLIFVCICHSLKNAQTAQTRLLFFKLAVLLCLPVDILL